MNTLDLATSDEPIVCSLSADELTVRQSEIVPLIGAGYQEARELRDGYALRFPGDDGTANALLAFILGERACCRFFTFELHFEPEQGAIWLSLRGPDGVKDMVRQMTHLA
jgi:hypothetical protein